MAFTCCSPDAREQLRVSKAIDLQLEQWKRDAKRELTVLVVGSEERGKSMLIERMVANHGQGYSERQRAEFKVHVYRSVFVGIQELIKAMEALQIPYENPANYEYKVDLLMVDAEKVTEISAECQRAIKSLWEDKGIQTCFHRRNEFQISDSAKFYLDRLDTLCLPDYIPTVEDVVQVHPSTTGIVEYTLQVQAGNEITLKLKIVDIRGQRSSRQKWIHCFEGVTAIIFLTAIDEYDQVLFEDETQNKLRESVSLFENIISYPWFQKAAIILLLNNTDLFHEKIARSDLARHFPAYKGPPGDPEAAKQFLLQLFLSVNPDPENKEIFSHFTQATDTTIFKRVFQNIQEHVVTSNLKDIYDKL